MAEEIERTFVIIKPDGVQRGFIGNILKRFERKGFKLCGLKLVSPSEELLRKHCTLSVHAFFEHLSSGPVVVMVWEGTNAVKSGLQIIGAMDPTDSATIRGDLSMQLRRRDIIYGSDSVESANIEIDLWFTEKEVIGWTLAGEDWLYKSNIIS